MPHILLDQSKLTRDRSALSDVAANQDVYRLIKDGVKVKARDERGRREDVSVRVIDWREPQNNDFFLASQVWVHGEMYRRRCRLVGFVNGLPLVFVEMQGAAPRLQDAYDKNLRDYRDTIPHLFCVQRRSSSSRTGSRREGRLDHAPWEHLRRVEAASSDEDREPRGRWRRMLRGTCAAGPAPRPRRELHAVRGGQGRADQEASAKNHQVLGVNRAIEAVQEHRGENQGRLGVFWHTQGRGKSLSMVFFAQKVLRTLPGNWTFVIVTDREELDDQICKTFAACGRDDRSSDAPGAAAARTCSSCSPRQPPLRLHADPEVPDRHRARPYPMLSDRADIIVITDEAHRSQYDTLAAEHAQRAAERRLHRLHRHAADRRARRATREVFGDYVSIYNFPQSIEDGATVPLYYENRKPELQLTNR